MVKQATNVSDLLYERMETTAIAGRAIADEAIERGGPTRMEACELRLMAIDQDKRRLQWASQLRSEGKSVNLLDSTENDHRHGLYVTNMGGDSPSLFLYGTIGARYERGLTSEDFAAEFIQLGGNVDVNLRIRSDGGDFYEALAMREVIMSRRGKTHAYIDGLAASGATLVACACSTVTMGIGSRYMIHEASGKLNGRADDFELAAEQLKKTNATIVKIYSERWKGTRGQLLDALHAETWFSDVEAVQTGLADRVSEKLSLAASISPRHGYKHVPSGLTIAAKIDDCPRLMAAQLALHRCAIVR